jgi:hypothetical protein
VAVDRHAQVILHAAVFEGIRFHVVTIATASDTDALHLHRAIIDIDDLQLSSAAVASSVTNVN